jgi:hypothetical protein
MGGEKGKIRRKWVEWVEWVEWWLVGGRGRRREWSDVLAEVKEGEAVDGCEEVVRGERWWVLWVGGW